jgi:hypothetical protein
LAEGYAGHEAECYGKITKFQSHRSDYPEIDGEKEDQKHKQRDDYRAGCEESPFDRVKKDSPRVESMTEIVEHGYLPYGSILQEKAHIGGAILMWGRKLAVAHERRGGGHRAVTSGHAYLISRLGFSRNTRTSRSNCPT